MTPECSCGGILPLPAVNPSLCETCRRRLARKKWRLANPEADKKSKRLWAKRNAAAKAAMNKAWVENNRARHNEGGKAWKKNNPSAMKKYRLRKYGLTVEQYDAMLASQDNRCAICSTATPAKHGSWCIDHDHKTNKARGLLCVKCNAGLGNFDENTGFLLAAERYLQLHRSPTSVRSPPGAGGHFLRAV